MIQYKSVQGTQSLVNPVEINVDTVYIRTNIKDIHTAETPILWQYDETQLTITEYLKQIVPQNQAITDSTTAELSMIIADYQAQMDKTLAELSILIGGENNV